MIVFYKKKVYLTSSYSKNLVKSNYYLICHINNLNALENVRKDSMSIGLKVTLLKNNMAKKIFVNNFSQFFSASTIVFYSVRVDLKNLKTFISKFHNDLFLLGAKIDNYFLTANMFNNMLMKYSLDKNLVMHSIAKNFLNVYSIFFNIFFKVYRMLSIICQR